MVCSFRSCPEQMSFGYLLDKKMVLRFVIVAFAFSTAPTSLISCNLCGYPLWLSFVEMLSEPYPKWRVI